MSCRKIQVDPVTRDHVFFYDNSSLFVMLDGRRYPRADPQHLHRLLTWAVDTDPLLTKTSSVPPKPLSPRLHKDETATYYKAQLMHFGLKPFKTKPAAKKALLAAFGDGHDLKVPERLVKLEDELKRLWDAESEKVRIRYEQKEKVREKKREKRLAELRRRHEAVLAEFDEEDIPLEAVPSRKRKATNDGGTGEKTARSSGRDKKFSAVNVQGKYLIDAPYLAEEWPDDASSGLNLTLAASRGTGRHLWGRFKFGVVTGIIRCGAPPETVGETVAFEWRGYEQGEGGMEYGPENTGTITFLADGKICGTMEGGFMTTFTFSGVRIQESQVWVTHVKKWKDQWRGINERREYELEAAQRRIWVWVKDMDYKERPAGSDTTSAGLASDDGEEIWDNAW